MDEYEEKSSQVIGVLQKLSDARAKKVLLGFCQDLINVEKSTINNNNTNNNNNNNSGSGNNVTKSLVQSSTSVTTTTTTTTTNTDHLHLSSSSSLNGSNSNINNSGGGGGSNTNATTGKSIHLIDLCHSHAKRSLHSAQPSILWKILEYSIDELDYLEQLYYQYKETKENQRLVQTTTSRLDEIASIIAFLNSPDKANSSSEYYQLLSTVSAQMKRVSLRFKGTADNNQYTGVVKYGWIEKRCGNKQSFRTWKKMWFILKSNELQYYTKDKGLSRRTSGTIQNGLEIINLEGEIGKKKEGKGWKVRWMKLLDNSLVYYRAQKEKEPLGIINLSECEWCDIYKDVSNKFVVTLKTGKFYFQTNSKDELTRWVSAIKSRIPTNQSMQRMDLAQFALKGIVYLANVTSVQDCNKFNTQLNCIAITTEKKNFYLSFDNPQDKNEWMKLITDSANNAHSRGAPIGQNSSQLPASSGSGSGSIRKWEVGQITQSPSKPLLTINNTGTSGGGSSMNLSSEDIKNEEDIEYGSQIIKKSRTFSKSVTIFNFKSPSKSPSSSGAATAQEKDDSDEGDSGEDEILQIPHTLKSEILRRSAHHMLKSFKIEVFIPSIPEQETLTFLCPDHVLVDQVKALIFKKTPTLENLPISEYRLGLDEDNLLEIEFLKFIYCNTMIELSLKTCGIVKIGVFHHRRDRRIKEKLYPDKFNPLLSSSQERLGADYSPTSTKRSINLSTSSASASAGSAAATTDNSSNAIQKLLDDTILNASPSSFRSSSTLSLNSNNSTNNNNNTDNNCSNNIQKTHSTPNSTLTPTSTSPSITTSYLEKRNNSKTNIISTVPSPTTGLKRQPLLQSCHGWIIEPTSMSLKSYNWKILKTETNFYRKSFLDSECVVSYLGVDQKVGPIAFTLVRTDIDNYRGILHTKHGIKTTWVDIKTINFGNITSLSKKLKKRKIISHLIGLVDSNIESKVLNLVTNQSELQKELLSLEERQTTSGFKFGLVVCKDGQIVDDDIFSNLSGNSDYEEFLDLLGSRIELMGWPNYSAGLDVKNNSTGTHSLYTDFKGNEVMFHVATMLPYTPGDPQQIERKRQVGNDICVIVFNEGNHSYIPSIITSQFNHVVIVVQFDKASNTYKLSVATKDDVEAFGPPIPQSLKKTEIREYLLTKLINAEIASLNAPVFSNKIIRTRETLLKYFIEQYT
ncbi:pleckstrin domain-containing protein [Heterostelium album PN500]|uniref:Pleckstrin domain-containing protein n=1 Tax=Heterostelium pallidum (strain ATCC 26659 / Pp 5 / PN500) TaxID=670386 RepID=D3BII9_HETP5|nr:pleckstrin domain-containing protein [Heterostelium album PN500]EFA78613.1 pleckstrin domain-containing protein [Heterostelium album PN500]|eukprot:XP_020430737.1 pleckstrin domain-containing protein [Heterostelium album PN500]